MSAFFNKFIQANASRIQQVADELSSFEIDAKKIGIREAKRRVKDWLKNFDKIGYANLDLPLHLLEKRDFIKSDYISDKLIKDADMYIEEPSAYIAPLGEPNESSFKITSKLHRKERFNISLNQLLDSVDASNKFKILLFDDFLNSGGQLVSVFYALLNRPLPDGEINDEADYRTTLNIEQIKKIKKAEIHLFYYQVFDEGTKRVEVRLKTELGLNISIHSHYYTNNNDSAFGDIEEQEKIEEGANGKLKHNSLFQGKDYTELREFYIILKNVGEALLRFNELKWEEKKFLNRALGYGNLCRVIITDSNIPTITLTALWQKGKIKINEIEIEWKELLPRTKKVIRKKMPSSDAMDYASGIKITPSAKELQSLKELYNLFHLKGGSTLSEELLMKYPFNIDIIRWWSLFNNRRMEWKLVRDTLLNKISESNNDAVRSECYLGIFESYINQYTRERHQSDAFIIFQEAKVKYLDSIPNKETNGKYYYFLTRFLEEEWWKLPHHAKPSSTIVLHAIVNINKSIELYKNESSGYPAIDIKPWWLYCHKTLLLKLWEHEEFSKSLKQYGELILKEIEMNPNRKSTQMYAITYFILLDNFEKIYSFLETLDATLNKVGKINSIPLEEDKICTVDNLTYHYVELIFYNDLEKQKQYHKIITSWFQRNTH